VIQVPKKPVLEIKKPHFTVKLHEDTLEVDLKEGAKKELEDVVEAHSILRGSLGVLFQTIIPLDVALHEIEHAEVDKKGRLKIAIPLRRDIVIPTEPDESKRLVEKLNELIPQAKLKEAEELKGLQSIEDAGRRRPKESI